MTLTASGGSLSPAGPHSRQEELEALINDVLSETRTAWEFVGKEIVPFESRELHEEVVVPALTLLGGRPGWERVEAA